MASEAQAIYLDWAGRTGMRFETLSCLSQGPSFLASTRVDAVKWASACGFDRPVLHDDGKSAGVTGWLAAAGIIAVPAQVIVGPDGVIRKIRLGYRAPQEIATDLAVLTGLAGPTSPPSEASLRWERIRHSLPHDPR
jgi:hypothetical protein